MLTGKRLQTFLVRLSDTDDTGNIVPSIVDSCLPVDTIYHPRRLAAQFPVVVCSCKLPSELSPITLCALSVVNLAQTLTTVF